MSYIQSLYARADELSDLLKETSNVEDRVFLGRELTYVQQRICEIEA